MFPSNNQTQLNDLYALTLQQQILQLLTQGQPNATATRMPTQNPFAGLFGQSFLPPQQQAQPRASLSQQVTMPSLHSSQIPMQSNFSPLAQTFIGQNRVNVEDIRRRPSLLSSGSSTSGYGGLLESGNGSNLTIDTRPTLNTNVEIRHSPMQPTIIDEELDRQKKEITEKVEKVDRDKRQAENLVQNLSKRRDVLRKVIAERSESRIDENEENGDDAHETSFIDRIYAENKRRVANMHNSNPLLKNIKGHNPLPLYQEPSDLPELHKIREDYIKMAPMLIKRIRNTHETNHQLIEEKHRKHTELYTVWQKKIEKWEKNPKKLAKDAKNREIYEKLFPEIKKSREEKERSIRSDRSRISMGGNLSMEKEEQREEDKYRNAAVIPPIACVGPPKHIFDNNNGLITDAFTEHKNRLEKFISSWRDDEKKIFEENISNYGKNFAAIALFLQSKSVKDCVSYYYMSKKKYTYKTKFARRKKKIGKQYKPPVMPQLGAMLPNALQQTIVSKSSRVLICLLCDAKIETYILPPQIMTRSACDMYGYDVNDPNSLVGEKLEEELAEFVRKTAEKTAQFEDAIEWAEDEISLLKMAIASHGTANWEVVAEKINLTRISAQHCQRKFEKMTAEGVWSINVTEEIKENIESVNMFESDAISQIREIKVEISEGASPELGTTSAWAAENGKGVENVKMEDKDDADIVILSEVRHGDQTSKKDAQLLTASNETQDQENSAAKSFGSITQGTPLLRSSQLVPQLMTANQVKSSFMPFEQAGMVEGMLPSANDPTNQIFDTLKLLGITPSQSVSSIESLMQQCEIIAKTLLINSFGVEPPREMIEQMKMKLVTTFLQPSQLQQQNPMLSTSLLNTPSTSILRKDPPLGASFGGSSEQIKKDMATASQMIAEQRKSSNEALLNFYAGNQKMESQLNMRPNIQGSSNTDSVIMKTTPEKTLAATPAKSIKQEVNIVESQHRSAFSTPSSAQNLRLGQQGQKFPSMYQQSPVAQPNLAKHLPTQSTSIVKIEDKKPPPPSSATLRIEKICQDELGKPDTTPARTRKTGLSTTMLPSPVSSAPTSQSIGGYKRTMSPSLTNLRSPAVGIQQRSRTPLDTTSLSTLTISTSQSQTSQPQTFGLAPQQQTAVQPSMAPEPIQPQIPAIATTVTATILTETSKPIAASPSQISIESKAPPATTSAPLSYSLLGPWAGSDSSAFNSRSTSSPSISMSSVKDETVTKSEAITIQSTFSSTSTAPVSEPRKEPHVELQPILQPPISEPTIASQKPTSATGYESLSDSDSDDADKRSTFSPPISDENKESASSAVTLFSVLALPAEEVITLSDAISTPPIRTPESTRSESVKMTPQSSSAPYVQPTYEPLSDDDD
uniref:Nuclear receptor corepressor 1 n=1 Tax=Acrobeloides nanus TaxID=290746 RepID=A0A914E6H0_9BILA